MSHYDQAMKHFHNHRKDRYTQQCAPLVLNTGGSKKEYAVITSSGEEYLVDAYCTEHAVEIFEEQFPGASVVEVLKTGK